MKNKEEESLKIIEEELIIDKILEEVKLNEILKNSYKEIRRTLKYMGVL